MRRVGTDARADQRHMWFFFGLTWGKVGAIRMFPARLLRLSGTNEGYPHLPQGVGHTHLRDGCLAILLSGRGDQMNKPYFNVFLYMEQLNPGQLAA